MYIMQKGALGALPPTPSRTLTTQGGLLKPNHQWVPYFEVDYSHQLKVCPKNPPFGCYIVNGYAWGQREWYPDEFPPYPGWQLQPLPKPFPHPQMIDLHLNLPKPAPKPAPGPAVKITTPVPTPPKVVSPVNIPQNYSPIHTVTPSPVPPVLVPTTVAAPPNVVPAKVDITSAPAADTTRHVGAVVGIGLVIATLLTLARKYS